MLINVKNAILLRDLHLRDRRPSPTIVGDEPLHLYGRSPVADETDVTIV